MPSRGARYRPAEIKAGVWIFIAVVVFIAFVIGISGTRFWSEQDYYKTRLEYVGGLEVGSPVRMGGLLVGKVSGIEILPPPASGMVLTLEVRADLPVKANATAYLSFISITSEQHLEIDQGRGAAPLLSPGDFIPSKELTTLDDAMEQIGYVSDTLRVILSNVNALLKPSNLAKVDSIISGVNAIVGQAGPEVMDLILSLRGAAAGADSLLDNVNRMLAGGGSQMDTVLLSLRRTLEEASLALNQASATMGSVDRVVLDNAGELEAILGNLRQATRNIEQLTSTVRENPFLLIRAIPKEQRKLEKP